MCLQDDGKHLILCGLMQNSPDASRRHPRHQDCTKQEEQQDAHHQVHPPEAQEELKDPATEVSNGNQEFVHSFILHYSHFYKLYLDSRAGVSKLRPVGQL